MGQQEVKVGGESVLRILGVEAVVAVALVGPLVADVAGGITRAVVLVEDGREVLQQGVVQMVGALGLRVVALRLGTAGLTLLLIFVEGERAGLVFYGFQVIHLCRHHGGAAHKEGRSQ